MDLFKSKSKLKPFFGFKGQSEPRREGPLRQTRSMSAQDPLHFMPMLVSPSGPPTQIPVIRYDTYLFQNTHAFTVQHAIASHFGVYLAERFDHRRPAAWERLSMEYIHPIFRQLASSLIMINMSAGTAAELLVLLLSTKYLKREQVIAMMNNVWDILINDPAQAPLFPNADHELFLKLYTGPSLDSFNVEFVWQLAKKLDHLVMSELGQPTSYLPEIKKTAGRVVWHWTRI